MPEPKVAIGMPWAQWIPGQAVSSFVPLVTTTLLNGLLCDVFMSGHNLLSKARELIVTESLNAGATHLLFVDADIIAPPDLVSRLLAHAKPVVSALYYNRNAPRWPVAYQKPCPADPLGPVSTFEAHEERDKGLLKVWCVGMGACLINAHVLRSLPRPLFEFYGEGEDICFARRCEEAGIAIYLDRQTVCHHVTTAVVKDRGIVE